MLFGWLCRSFPLFKPSSFSRLLRNRPRGCEHAVGWWKNLNLHPKLFIQAIDFQAFTAQIQKHVILAEGNPTPNDWKSFRETQLWPPTASEDPLPTLRRPWRPAWPPSVLPATSWQSWKRWTVGNDDWPGQPTRFCWLLQHPCKVNRLNRLCSADFCRDCGGNMWISWLAILVVVWPFRTVIHMTVNCEFLWLLALCCLLGIREDVAVVRCFH